MSSATPSSPEPSHRSLAARAIRTVALFEAAKGTLVLVSGFGLLTLVHHRAGHFAAEILHRFHLNPASRYPRIFLDAAESLTDARLWLLALFAFGYAAMRLAEAYGLWWERAWAEWFAVASGGLYVPIELYELTRGVTWPKLLALTVNIGIAAVMARALMIRPRHETGAVPEPDPSSAIDS